MTEPTTEAGRHQRNGHTLELDGCMWRCLQCRHEFDAAVDAERFWCGDDCTDKHPDDGPEVRAAIESAP